MRRRSRLLAARGLAGLLGASLALVLSGTTAAQDGAAESDLERFLRAAKSARRVVRPQAAERLVELGVPAAERLLAECGAGPRDMAALGSDLVEVLGRFEDARLRARLWQAFDDRDFPWRPAAARGLAGTARLEEAERLLALTADRLSPVRVAGIQALARLEARDARPRLRELLSDENDRVRREAAKLLDAWGEHDALAWIVEELGREDHFFQQRTGELARHAAFRFLVERLGDGYGYDPRKSRGENAASIARIRARCRELAGGELPELPHVARAGRALEGNVLGLELRSCREGEYFLRCNTADVLYVGTGNPVAIELPEGSVVRLLERATELVQSLGRERLWGTPGCDIEQVHFLPEPGGRPQVFIVSKGPDVVVGLRPLALTQLAQLSLEQLSDLEDAPDLHASVQRAFAAIGGSLDPETHE